MPSNTVLDLRSDAFERAVRPESQWVALQATMRDLIRYNTILDLLGGVVGRHSPAFSNASQVIDNNLAIPLHDKLAVNATVPFFKPPALYMPTTRCAPVAGDFGFLRGRDGEFQHLKECPKAVLQVLPLGQPHLRRAATARCGQSQ